MRTWTIPSLALVLAFACNSQPPLPDSPNATAGGLMSTGWIDVSATLDPATTPIYEGDAPMKFEFLKDMRCPSTVWPSPRRTAALSSSSA